MPGANPGRGEPLVSIPSRTSPGAVAGRLARGAICCGLMKVALEFEGRRLAEAKIPALPGGRRVLLPVLRRAADALLAEGARRQGVAPTCRAGCAACCRQLVPLASAEADDLRARLARLPAPRRAALEARFGAARRRLAATGLEDLLMDVRQIPPEGLEVLGGQYLEAGVDCPFLEDDRCMIYRHRPLACRQYSVSSPPDECAGAAGRVRRIAPAGRAINAALDAADGTSWIPLPMLLDGSARSTTRGDDAERLASVWRHATAGRGALCRVGS